MHSFLEIASGDDEVVDYADWVETCTLFKTDSTVSQEDLSREIHRSGIASESRARSLAADAFDEIADRVRTLGTLQSALSCYPFKLSDGRDVVELKQLPRGTANYGLAYLFLLAVTRSNMHAKNRVLDSVDPTAVFERLCADVLFNFWGGREPQTGKYIIGTARVSTGARRFPSDINELCRQLGDGAGWKSTAKSPGAGDGGVDIAVWTRFRDGRAGGLVGFAQCKTGNYWREHLSKHPPRSFSTRYFSEPLINDPIKIYMVPCRISERRWLADTSEGGLLFDRCRIIEYASKFDPTVVADCRTWFDKAVTLQTMDGTTPSMIRRRKRKK